MDEENTAMLDALHWFRDQRLAVEYSRHVEPPEWWAECRIGPGVLVSTDHHRTPTDALGALRTMVEDYERDAT